MRIVKSFEEFLEEGVIKKGSNDVERARSMLSEAKRKFFILQNMVDRLGIDDTNANDYVEYCYNIIMFLIRAKMYEQGFSSVGHGAHEAEVAFSRKLKFSETEVRLLNKLRYFRNGILYYGKQFDKEYAEIVIQFTTKIYTRFI
ncbi:hypothetical protein COT72_04095 [archaeon CG10_big_fil_rev_8_21_14_0_10_43_11]|nr:MAG: hypothetical protein COT72_04095 [archaeon CG10_big_fil_rev_8_21_14_0_10_43_11]